MQLAVGKTVAGRSGLYFNQMNEARANQQAYDAAARQKLWDMSIKLIDVRAARTVNRVYETVEADVGRVLGLIRTAV